MTDLADIRAFVEVTTSSGFTRAARRLGVSKSLLSRRVARLENDLGVRLLTRTTRAFRLTEAGLEFVERGRRILADLSAAREALTEPKGEVSGVLRVSVPFCLGARRLAPVFAHLHARHPRLGLDITYDDRMQDLTAERFDVAVRVGILQDSPPVARQIARCSLIVVASPEYLQRHAAPTSPLELTNHECLIYTGAPRISTWNFTRNGRAATFTPRGRFRADVGESLIAAAEAGLGVTALPDFLVRDSVEARKLVPVLTDYTIRFGGIYILRPSTGDTPARTREFIESMVETFAKPETAQEAPQEAACFS